MPVRLDMGFSTWGNFTNQTVRLSGQDLEIAEPRQSGPTIPCIWRVSDSSLPEHAPNTVSLSPGEGAAYSNEWYVIQFQCWSAKTSPFILTR